jgi:hypothetical protein
VKEVFDANERTAYEASHSKDAKRIDRFHDMKDIDLSKPAEGSAPSEEKTEMRRKLLA